MDELTNGIPLAACPFCGSAARRGHAGEWFGTGCDGDTKCPAFLSGLMYRTQEAADAAWNHRADTSGVSVRLGETRPPTDTADKRE